MPLLNWLRRRRARRPTVTPRGSRTNLESVRPFAAFALLERVVAIVQTQASEERALTLTSLELYDDGFILRFHLRDLAPYTWQLNPEGTPLSPITQISRTMFRVEDDMGREYEAYFAGGAGGTETYRGEVRGRPAIRAAAKRLNVRAADAMIAQELCFVIDLT